MVRLLKVRELLLTIDQPAPDMVIVLEVGANVAPGSTVKAPWTVAEPVNVGEFWIVSPPLKA